MREMTKRGRANRRKRRKARLTSGVLEVVKAMAISRWEGDREKPSRRATREEERQQGKEEEGEGRGKHGDGDGDGDGELRRKQTNAAKSKGKEISNEREGKTTGRLFIEEGGSTCPTHIGPRGR
jgi:hypothetical protein